MCYSFHKKAVVAKDSKAIACELSCHNWHCKDCGKVKQRAWLERFKNFAELACHFEITVHCSKLDRDSFVRKLRRHFCHYMIVRIDGRYEIFHTPIYGNCRFKPDRSKWFTPAKMLWNAKRLLDMAVSVQHHVRITTSRSVPKPLSMRNSREEKWVTVAKTPLSIEEMNRRISRAGYSEIQLGEVFPLYRIGAVIGEDFQLSALASKQFQDVFALIQPRTLEAPCETEAQPIGTFSTS